MRFDADRYFAAGGPANVSPAQREAGNFPKKHERVAGLPIAIENPKGSTRLRQDSGPAKMAADYGQIVGSAKDADKMDVDTYVGPYKDSDRVFVINQQHPHSKRFNEHKVMLGYKDRAHAVHDYVHSFADGQGHKRVQSIVEMGKHEFKDWVKHGRHNVPIKKAGGGPVISPRNIAAQLQGPEEQGAQSPSFEGVGEGLETVGRGAIPLAKTVGEYAASRAADPSQIPSDIGKAGSALAEGFAEDPIGTIAGALPGVGNVMAAADVAKLKDEAKQARAEGDDEKAALYDKLAAAAALGVVMPVGGGAAARSAAKAGEKAAVRAVERQLSPLGFYSHAAEMAESLPQAKGSPAQFKSTLMGEKYGVKPAEMEGFDEAFANRPSVTREEIAAHFKERIPQVEETVLGTPNPEQMKALRDEYARAEYGEDFSGLASEYKRRIDDLVMDRRSTTKFGQYTLPGGENYREVLLKLPDQSGALRKETAEAKSLRTQAVADYANAAPGSPEAVEAQARIKKYTKIHTDLIGKNTNLPPEFRSSHWDDPNVLAHLRMADRTGPNDEKILHVEEIQSDWGQQGKKRGFARNLNENEKYTHRYDPEEDVWEILDPQGELVDVSLTEREARDAARQFEQGANMAFSGGELPPTAPYVTNTTAWTDLALKRALKEAAEGGYDKMVWTPGAEQAKRYDLSKQIGALHLEDGPRGEQMLRAYGPSGDHIINKHIIDAKKELPDLVGKEAAEKLLSQTPAPASGNQGPTRSLTGLDLQTGGEGMKGYYDKIVPNQLSKLVKKLDPESKIGRETLSTSPITPEQLMEQRTIPDRNQVDFHSLTITPKMREAIMKGQTAYAEGGEVEARKPSVGHPSAHIALVSDLRKTAKDHGFQKPAMTHLIKMMGIPTPRASVYAHNVLNDPQLHHKINPATEKFLITLHGAMKHTAAQKHTGELRRHLRDRVIYGNP